MSSARSAQKFDGKNKKMKSENEVYNSNTGACRTPEMAIPILLGGCYVYVYGPFVLISSAFANILM